MADTELPVENAIVFGASGAIGQAFTTAIANTKTLLTLTAVSRQPLNYDSNKIHPAQLSIYNEASIATLANQIEHPLDLIIIATGILHSDELQPEKSLKSLSENQLATLFHTNAIIPALIMKHFAPLLRKDSPSILMALSARVGSITDNRLGGWYSYRASKSALNMLIKCAAIEISRKEPKQIIVGFHPGTVDSYLSKPFQSRLKPDQLQSPEMSVEKILTTIQALTSKHSGQCLAYDGTIIEP